MKLTRVITYIDEDKNELSFVPVENVPGYTHRVCFNRIQFDWLPDSHKPNEKLADFLIRKAKPQYTREGMTVRFTSQLIPRENA